MNNTDPTQHGPARPARWKGYLLGALAAAAYGTNPAFAVPLYADGMNPNSVLLFRYIMGLPLLAALLISRGRSLRLAGGQAVPVAVLGILMAFSSLALFESYRYMNSGVASTLLFVYPIMVAVLMLFFFHEKFRPTIVICLALMCCGLGLLMRPGDGDMPSGYGCLLVMVSALTYAIYIVMVNVSRQVRGIPTTRLLFYVLLSGSLVFIVMIPFGSPLTLPSGGTGWLNLAALAVIPTVLSLGCTTLAIQSIGSTPTAILGALEPVSAVVLSIIVLHQPVTGRELLGGCLILAAATLVIIGGSFDTSLSRALLRIRRMFPARRRD